MNSSYETQMKGGRFFGAILLGMICLFTSPVQADELTIGSKAPELDISHWVSNGKGKFEEVTEFKSGKVYVVEFWATWCGPCIMSMPHLVEIQKEYGKDVQIISVSDEDLPTVVKFLMKTVRGEEDQLYGELTSSYCLTTDPDESVYEDYMRAAGQNGIPTAFIVGKAGEIEWIGHPMRMDKPLHQVVNDEWDREAYQKEMEAEKKAAEAFRKFAMEIRKMKKDAKPEEVIAKIDEHLAGLDEDDATREQIESMRISTGLEAGGELAVDAMNKLSESDVPGMINFYAWQVVEKVRADKEVEPAMLQAACEAAKKAVDLAKEEGNKEQTAMIMDTHANLLFHCDKLDEAITVQKEAVEMSSDPQLNEFLEKLIEEKKKKDA